jgi:hypothetical protein
MILFVVGNVNGDSAMLIGIDGPYPGACSGNLPPQEML